MPTKKDVMNVNKYDWTIVFKNRKDGGLCFLDEDDEVVGLERSDEEDNVVPIIKDDLCLGPLDVALVFKATRDGGWSVCVRCPTDPSRDNFDPPDQMLIGAAIHQLIVEGGKPFVKMVERKIGEILGRKD